MVEGEIGGVRIIIESQLVGRRNKDLKMSSAPSYGPPGDHIFVVAVQILK